MNGRALNEKAIEVSPSSSRVLDRAADILTPFPPSKNRPRPGDWTCPSCGFSNFQRRTACFRCSYPAVGEQPHQMYGGYGYGHPGMMPHQQMSHGHGMHHGGGGGGMGRGGGESRVPFRAGDWRCGADGCNYHNFAKNISCLRCGASRATAALSAVEVPGMDGHGYGGGPPAFNSGYAASGYPQAYGGAAPSPYAMPSGVASYGPYGAGPGSRTESYGSQPGFANGYGGQQQQQQHDPFNFLSAGLSNLSMGPGPEAAGRNGAGAKSPA